MLTFKDQVPKSLDAGNSAVPQIAAGVIFDALVERLHSQRQLINGVETYLRRRPGFARSG